MGRPWLRGLWVVAAVAGTAITSWVGCAKAIDPSTSGGDGGTSGGECDAGLSACGADCVDLTRDAKNCGACGTACGTDEACVKGACSLSCGSAKAKCGQTCVTLSTDPTNCGSCGVTCEAGLSCVQAACTLVCDADAGQTKCTDQCVDTQTDVNNCGTCGTPCTQGQTCQSGVCCDAGLTNCNGTCVDLTKDKDNCGKCGMACSGGTPVCVSSACSAGDLVGTLGNQSFYKVLVSGTMTDTNVYAACTGAGFSVGCQATNCPQYTDNVCVPTQESSCGNPMYGLAQALGCSSPSSCAQLNGVYQYMGHKWQSDAACGVESGSWCSTGTSYSNRYALCVQ